LPLEYTA